MNKLFHGKSFILLITLLFLVGGFFVSSGTVFASETTVTTQTDLTTAISTAVSGDVISVDGVLGSTDAYTLYEIMAPNVTIRGVDGNKIYGTFNLKGDGDTLDSLNVYSRGGGSDSLKNAVNVVSFAANITNCRFEMSNADVVAANGGVGNGVVIWPFGSATSNLNITGNTFVGYGASVPGWSSTGLLIAENIDLARVGMHGTSSTSIFIADEHALATGNTYINNNYDYVHQDWGNGGDWSFSKVSNSAGFSDAIDNSAANATILLSAGEYTYATAGQIVISKNLTIVGADKATTIIKPTQDTSSSGDARGWFLIPLGVTFNLSNVTLDGAGHLIYMGIYYWGDGTVNNCIIKNIKYNENGPDYQGRGMIIKGNVNVTNSTFSEMGRIAIQYYGGGGTASGNTMTGKGSGDWLDYGFDIGNGAIVSVENNNISNDLGVASTDGSKSAAVMATTYFGPGTQATVTGNTLINNSIGIAAGYDATDTAVVVAHNNNLSGNTQGLVSTNLTVDATNNWWGSALESDIQSKISGLVTYTPWYINPGRTVLNTAFSSGGGGGSNIIITITAPTIDFSETTDGGVSLPSGTSDIVLGNDSVMDFSSSTNSSSGGNITIAGNSQTLSSFTSGDLSNVNLSAPQNIGGQTITVDKAVTLSSGSTGMPTVLSNSALANVSVSIPDDTTILAPSGWTGTIAPPKPGSNSGTAPSGFSVGNTVISVGSSDVVLIFDKPVTLTLTGVTGAVGYKPAGAGAVWTTINTTCSGTYDAPTGAVFPGECKISNGADTKILTFHFTSFGGLNENGPTGSGGLVSGGGGGNSPAAIIPASIQSPVINSTPAISSTPVGQVLGATTIVGCVGSNRFSTVTGQACPLSSTVGQVLGATSYNFTKVLRKGFRGNEVMELQKFLIAAGYDVGKTDGIFGVKVKAALIKFQLANKLKGDGVVGPAVRAILNK